jgi:hypothetical protein
MPCPPAATLQIVALDSYHSHLLVRMLDLLNSRLRHAWKASESGPGDATLVDVDDEQGRRHLSVALDRGQGGRLIALGSSIEAGPCHTVAKPLRLGPLLAALIAIEAGAGPARSTRRRISSCSTGRRRTATM